MTYTHGKTVVVALGGSVVYPDQIDTAFIKNFKKFALSAIAKHKRKLVVVIGGGRLARLFQDAASRITRVVDEDKDWIGIHATRLNAQLLRNIFVGYAHPQVIKNPTIDIDANEPIIIAAGWQPGCSTDYDAVLVAKNIGATRLVNLSNIDYVYDKDPRKNPDAKKIEKISWTDFRKLIPAEWDPGLSSPFDPVAAKEAESIGLEVAIMNGTKLEEFSHYLDGKSFVGTVIS